jgi:NAD-dependent SIR2 family protein deacetylase
VPIAASIKAIPCGIGRCILRRSLANLVSRRQRSSGCGTLERSVMAEYAMRMNSFPVASPLYEGAAEQGGDALLELLGRSRRLVVLTGAGCSTDSGIPDYRDSQGAWKRAPPMHYQQFMSGAAARQRYWARALIGWRAFRDVAPNAAHRALARLEHAGRLDTLITQNVDGLHQRAGSSNVIDLHGRIDSVECLQCARRWPRERVQERLEQSNPHWSARVAEMAPDADAVLTEIDFSSFRLVDCEHCAGTLKPAVVFFGESVPEPRVRHAYAAVQGADALLVVGSSLMVYSGYRFVQAAGERGIPVAILNVGRTRADAAAAIKVEAPCAAVLQRIAQQLAHRPAI